MKTRFCSKPCCKRASKRRAAHRKVLSKRNLLTTTLGLFQIWLKTGGICHICLERVDLDAKFPAPESPSIDRIDSSKGFLFENAAIAHLNCNSIKRDTKVSGLIPIEQPVPAVRQLSLFDGLKGGVG